VLFVTFIKMLLFNRRFEPFYYEKSSAFRMICLLVRSRLYFTVILEALQCIMVIFAIYEQENAKFACFNIISAPPRLPHITAQIVA
jgi:hypothetical protein